MAIFKSGIVQDYMSTNAWGPWTRIGTRVARTFTSVRPVAVKRKRPIDLTHNTTSWSVSSSLAVDGETWVPQKESNVIYKRYAVSAHAPLNASVGQTLKTADVRSLAYNKCLAQVKQDQVNLAQMLGEYRQTADLFSSACKKLYYLTQAVRHRDPRILQYDLYRANGRLRDQVSRRTARKLSGYWLEYIYGVVPLAQDVHESMVALQNASTGLLTLEFEGRVPARKSLLTKTSSLMGGPTVYNTVSEARTSKVKMVIDVDNLLLLQSLGAYGFTNPFQLAWELTPFSFVIDWWVNVGEVLASLDNCLYIKSGKWFAVDRYSYSRGISVAGGYGSFQESSYSRSALSPITQTVSRFRYKPSTSLIHIANGTALVASLLTGSKQSFKLRS